jgi:hypothetical protein
MKTKKIILGAVVVLGAYYLYNKYKVKSEIENIENGADYPPPPPIPFPVVTGVVTNVKELLPVFTKKQSMCEDKWQNEIGSVSRLSPEALEKSKSDYVKNCIAS